MKAIILGAGQGKRLLPATVDKPKCMLQIGEKTIIEWQIDNLHKYGIKEIVVITGFQSLLLEDFLQKRYGDSVKTIFNPFYSVSDNLMSCWIAYDELNSDFMIINGDTLFEAHIINKLLSTKTHNIIVTIDTKDRYDADDMKVTFDKISNKLLRVGKDIPLEEINGEAIGIHFFRDKGPYYFRKAIQKFIRDEKALKMWYLSIINELAINSDVGVCCIKGLKWVEIDYPEDLKKAESTVVNLKKHQTKLLP
jgi:choline kinase